MAEIVLANPASMIGGTALKAAGLVAADTAETGVVLGHGMFCVYGAWTAAEILSNDEFYMVTVEANTRLAPTVWTNIGYLFAVGALEVEGGEGDAPATGSVKAGFFNPYDYQVRVKCWVNGTIATGLNYLATAFPIQNLAH